MIRCGHCGGVHARVIHVRHCANLAHDRAAREAEQAAEAHAEWLAERRAEAFWESGSEAFQAQYQWEVEQDERNAAFWAGAL